MPETKTLIDSLDFKTALGKLSLDDKIAAAIKACRLFYKGDHWQNGDGWIGPHPLDGNPLATEIMSKFQRIFVSKNLIKECVNRKRNAVIGNQPNFTVTVRRQIERVPAQIADPTDPTGQKKIDDPSGAMVDGKPNADEQKLIDEANAALTPWWDEQKILNVLQEFALRRTNFGKAALRMYVPPGQLSDTGRAKAADLQAALKLVFVEAVEPEDAVIFTDKTTMKSVSIFRVTDPDSPEDERKTTLELSALDGSDKTVIVELSQESDSTAPTDTSLLTQPVAETESGTPTAPTGPEVSDPLALGGRLALFVAEGEALTSDQVRQNQKLLNLALTMCGHNVVEAGFSERVISNAEIPGTWVPDPNAEGGKRFVPDPLPRGAGVTTALAGLQYVDEAGNTHVLTPSVEYRDPAPVETFVQTKELAKINVYEEVHQMHAQITGDATASGVSRIQALADFVLDARDLKVDCDNAGQYAVETALAYAAQIMGSPDKFKGLRVDFDCKIDTGPLTPEERSALQAEVAARLRSRESYMVLTGQADPQAQLVQIKKEETEFPAPVKVVTQPNDPTPTDKNSAA